MEGTSLCSTIRPRSRAGNLYRGSRIQKERLSVSSEIAGASRFESIAEALLLN